MSERVEVWAPATVANVGCGFDIFGFAVEGLGDEVQAWTSDTPGVRIDSIEGDGGVLPLDAARNTAGVAAAAVLEAAGQDAGIVLHIRKGIPASGGLGSSAASAVAGAVAANALLQAKLLPMQLLVCALRGEEAAVGTRHADNVAPCLYGGFTLARNDPVRVDPLPVPPGLACALVRPRVRVATRDARAVLPERIAVHDAVHQMGNVAALVDGLHRGDLDQIASALEDRIAESVRAAAVPGFSDMMRAASEAGALGGSLSGSGPTVFALTRSVDEAKRAARAMKEACPSRDADAHVSLVGTAGARVISEES